jgi:hypothetical protein
MLEGDVSDVRALDRCRTKVSYGRLRTMQFNPQVPSTPLREPSGGLSRTIDWSLVHKVKIVAEKIDGVPTGATFVDIEMKNGGLSFKYSDQADAERVGFALDFLREACAPKNETGF